MSARKPAVAILVGTAILLNGAAAFAGDGRPDGTKLPEAVAAAVATLGPDGPAGSLKAERAKKGDYEVHFHRGSTTVEARIAADGTVRRVEERRAYTPRATSTRNERIGAAASAAEDIAEAAQAGDPAGVDANLAKLAAALPELRPLVGAETLAGVERHLGDAKAGAASGDAARASLAAVEAFRVLEGALDHELLPVPRQVALLDYAGFKLRALAHAPAPDWSAIGAAADEARGFWTQIEPKVADKGLNDLLASVGRGMSDAVQRRNAQGVAFAAQLTLDTVDLLEKHFVSTDGGPQDQALLAAEEDD